MFNENAFFTFRMSLDDNHRSVVLACARAIQCALSFEINEDFFEIVEVRL